MGCDHFVSMDPNYRMYCHLQWKIRKNCMHSRKNNTLLSGVIVHSADLLMYSDILIVLIFASYPIFLSYLYYAALHILYINSWILASRKIVSEWYFEMSFTHKDIYPYILFCLFPCGGHQSIIASFISMATNFSQLLYTFIYMYMYRLCYILI